MNRFYRFAMFTFTSAILLFPLHAKSTTCMGTISTWPKDSLPINGRIIITGSLNVQKTLRNIAHYNPRLVGKNHTVPLSVGAIYESLQSMTQTVLIPIEPLHPSKQYRLEIDSNLLIYNVELFEDDSLKFIWTATNTRDNNSPVWEKNPIGVEAWAQGLYGYYCIFETQMRDEEQVAIEVALAGSGVADQKFILTECKYDQQTKSYRFGFGQNECAGNLSIAGGDQYRVRYTAIDPAGNRTECRQSCLLILGSERIKEEKDDANPYPPSDWYRVSILQEDCTSSP